MSAIVSPRAVIVRVQIECQGQIFVTYDEPEHLGPWVGRIFSFLGPAAGMAMVRFS